MNQDFDDAVHEIAWQLAEWVMKRRGRTASTQSNIDEFLELKWRFTAVMREALSF